MATQRCKMKKTLGYVIIILGLIAFSCCVAAEFTKATAKGMKVDGNLCSLPRTTAFGLGVVAAICLSAAQIMGTSVAGNKCSREKRRGIKQATVAYSLLALSWFSFGLAVTLLATATSMNRGQSYGTGWLDSRCYVVKPGIYFGAAVLTIITIVFVFAFTSTTNKGLHPSLLDEQIKSEKDSSSAESMTIAS